ncbi:MAG: hypothetical protein GYB65_21005 [Chloroflexi bacterium]|nr:hypothetical protein [Chloroflexota bacterium]
MPKYELFHPDTEILGQVILDFQRAINSERFHDILEDHGLAGIDADTWYPAQAWVDALNAIAHQPSSMMDFVSIGIRQLELALMPPEFDDMPMAEILRNIEEAYQLNYRGTDIGSISVDVVAENHVRMTVRSFEPDDLWYGNIHGILRRFLEPGTSFTVAYDPTITRHDLGGPHTVFDITWELY